MALVRLSDGEIQPLTRPVGLKDNSLEVIRAFCHDADIGPVVQDRIRGTMGYLRPPVESVQRALEPAPVDLMVFTQFKPGSAPVAHNVTRARAFALLVDQSFNYSRLGLPGFEALARLIESCPSYEIRYGSLDDGLSLISQLHRR